MAGYWSETTAEERRDMVGGILLLEGLIVDLERQIIVALLPRPSVLPVLALGLEKAGKWEQRETGLWLRSEFWPPKKERETLHVPPPHPPGLTPEQQQEAITLLKHGMSSRQVAKQFGVSHQAIHRLVKKEHIVLESNVSSLSPFERQEALALIQQGLSIREVARRFGVNHEWLRRMVKRSKP